jgi:predicted transcriptional regulator
MQKKLDFEPKRLTTIEAYNKVKESGLLSCLRLKVYKILLENGQLTANEMRMFASSDVNSGVFSTRLSELERMGVVRTIGTRKCKTSGHNALVWEVTGDLPIKFERKKTKKDKREDLLNKIKELMEASEGKWLTELTDIYDLAKNM